MGRGRAKAKQAKVARQLKYSGGGTDLDRLRAELGVGAGQQEADGQDGSAGDRFLADDEEDDDELEPRDDGDDGEPAHGMSGHRASTAS